ncbi:hypothetical protein [Salinarimonas soli]|uniref:Uncharacterized protein n=1 Tax=Salinarimonas soli TaxID=1638099 RepID=A0A5B2VFN5_9HYPH|nr:hypothetical protein [Salinarimonas soli]KAA2237675.1 hypothetical protein F0L46_08315 [Salinarimonas soli]
MVRDRSAEIMRLVSRLSRSRVLVGIPSDAPERRAEAGEPKPDITNAVIGYVQEFGDPARNIPERPFLVPGVASVEDRIVAEYRAAAKKTIQGDTEALGQAEHRVGLIAQNAVRAKITEGPFAPLAPQTLARRRARGRTGERPLIDTGQLRMAVTYVIRPRRQ